MTTLLQDLLGIRDYEIGICLVNEEEISRINESFLGHKGCTDVITFDHGEIVVSVGSVPPMP